MVGPQNYCYFNILPVELLALQPSYYLLKSDIGRLDSAMTSRKLRPIWLEALQKMSDVGDIDVGKNRQNAIEWKINRRIPLKSLTIHYHVLIDAPSLRIGPPLPSMDVLTLEGDIYSHGFAETFTQSVADICCRFPNLKELIIKFFSYIPPAVVRVVGSCPSLRTLQLWLPSYPRVHTSAEQAQALLLYMCELSGLGSQINALHIVCSDSSMFATIWDTLLHSLPNLTTLSLLALSSSPFDGDFQVSQVALTYPSLCRLEMTVPSPSHGRLDGMVPLPQLRVLHLHLGTDEHCILFAQCCPLLEDFAIEQTTAEGAVSDVGVIAIALGCPLLVSIILHCRETISDTAIETIAASCPRLQKLYMLLCSKVSLSSVLYLLQTVPALETLRFHCVTTFSSTAIVPILYGPLPLQNIAVAGVEGLSDDLIETLVNSCPGLTNVSLVRCSGLTRACLQHFVSLERLQELYIQGCELYMSRAAIREYKESLPSVNICMSGS